MHSRAANMTFYEALAALFARAAERLSGGDTDGLTQRQIREVTVFLRRMNAMWPELFSCLGQETSVLRAGLLELNSSIRRAGIAAPLSWSMADQSDDPLVEYRRLLRVCDEAMTFLREHRRESWADHALEQLRNVLADAVRIQGRLVDLALDA